MEFEELEIGQKKDPIIMDYRVEVKRQRKEIDLMKDEIDSLWKLIQSFNEEFQLGHKIAKKDWEDTPKP